MPSAASRTFWTFSASDDLTTKLHGVAFQLLSSSSGVPVAISFPVVDDHDVVADLRDLRQDVGA